MNEQMYLRCTQLIENKTRIKSVFPWESSLTHLSCAGIYAMEDKLADPHTLQTCKELLKQKVGAFSGFRGTARAPIAAMLACSGNPEQTLDRGLAVYDLLRKEFWSSDYLPLAAMTLAQMAKPAAYVRIAARTKAIYTKMKTEHPFLTSCEDSALCALMAISDKPDNALICDAETCYQILKPNFFSGNAVQSLSHVLALCDGQAAEKCQRVLNLFAKLKAAGLKYGTDYELPTLGVLAMTQGDLDKIVCQMGELDQWLSAQKGFGIFSSISKKQRLMYAGMLTQKNYIQSSTMQTAAVCGTISLLVAQQAAMCATIAASAAANAASN